MPILETTWSLSSNRGLGGRTLTRVQPPNLEEADLVSLWSLGLNGEGLSRKVRYAVRSIAAREETTVMEKRYVSLES